MKKIQKISTMLLLCMLSSLCACNSGKPDTGAMTTALEKAITFETRKLSGESGLKIRLGNLEAMDCVENAGKWLCKIKADMIATHPKRGEMKDDFSTQVTFAKVNGDWVAEVD